MTITVKNNRVWENTATLSYLYTCDAEMLVVMFSEDNSDSVTGCKYADVDLTLAKRCNNGVRDTYVYYLPEPASGENALAWTVTGGMKLLANAIGVDGARKSNPIGNVGENTGIDVASLGVTVNLSKNSILFGALVVTNLTTALTPYANVTETADGLISNAASRAGCGYRIDPNTGGDFTIGWSWGAAKTAAIAAAEIKAAPVGGQGVVMVMSEIWDKLWENRRKLGVADPSGFHQGKGGLLIPEPKPATI